MKQNNISLILATKGSGKSILANALALAQKKQTFFISPIKNSMLHQYNDEINAFKDVELDDKKNYFFYIEPEQLDDLLSDLSELQNVLIVIDEVDIFYNARISNTSALYKLINLGRHNENDLICLSRRPVDMPTTLRSQADTLYLGHIGKEVNNKLYIEKWLGEKYTKAIDELPRFSFIKVPLSSKEADTFIRLDSRLVEKISYHSKEKK